MKILLNLHKMKIGGAQLVALRLAGALKERGHETLVYGPPGRLADLARSRGLRVIPQITPNGRRPSRRAALELRDLSRDEDVDIVHASGHSVCIEAFLGPYLRGGFPLVCSIRGAEAVPSPYPRSIPLILAHQYVAEAAQRSGFKEVHVIRPVVDTETEHPGVDASEFLDEHQLDNHVSNVVMVSRLAEKAKLEGLERAIAAVELLAHDWPVRLIIVGDGIAFDRLVRRADEVNRRLGRRVVVLTGPMLDPGPSYAAADVVVGMQGAILRGMAFQKPAIVVGEKGFSEIVSPESTEEFLRKGFYGIGDGDLSPERLAAQLSDLLGDASHRERLGRFARGVVREHASLSSAADRLEAIYRSVLERPPSRVERLAAGAAFSSDVVAAKIRRLVRPGETLAARRIATWNQA